MRSGTRFETAGWFGATLIAAIALGALAWEYLSAVNLTEPLALAPEQRPAAPPLRRPRDRPERVVWVVLDGLRLDVSRTMPWLNERRVRGFDGVAEAPLPSLSRPSYAAMATGAEPVDTGVRNNGFRGPVPLDSVFDRAAAAGLGTRGIANLGWWNDLFGRSFDSWRRVGHISNSLERDLELALVGDCALTLIHLTELDGIGHHQGVGAQYQQTALELDRLLSERLAGVDPARAAFVISSDHGHRGRGGHGGPEPEVRRVPLVLAGKGIRRGKADVGSVARIGPTLAVLLGLELPRDLRVGPAFELLDPALLGAEYLAQRREDAERYRAEYARRLEPVSSGSLRASVIAGGVPRRALAALLVLAAGAAAYRRARPHGRRGFLALPLIAVGVLAVLRIFDLPLSFSAIVEVELLVVALSLGVAAGVLLYLCGVWALFRGSKRDGASVAKRFHLRAAALAYLAFAPLLWVAFGYSQREALAPPALMYLPLPAAFVGATSALLLAGVSLVASLRLTPEAAPPGRE